MSRERGLLGVWVEEIEQGNQHAFIYSGKVRALLLRERIIDFESVCRDQGREMGH